MRSPGEGTHPMRRNRLTLGALLVSVLIATAACSGSESGGSAASLTEGGMAAGAASARPCRVRE